MSRTAWTGAALLTAGLLLAAAPPAAAADTLVPVVRVVNGAAGAQLVFVATGTADNGVIISGSGATLTLTDGHQIKAGPGCVTAVYDNVVTCTAPAGWAQLRVTLGAGDDRVNNDTDVPLRADGGAGNDQLVGGPGADILIGGPGDDVLPGLEGDDLIEGGDGHDELTGGPGADVLDAGAGDDAVTGDGWRYFPPVQWPDTLRGGAGTDTLHLEELMPLVELDLNGTAAGTGPNGRDGVDGAFEHAEILADRAVVTGNAAGNVIEVSGRATIDGLGGNDRLTAGSGGTRLSGGAGDDDLTIGDTITSGSPNVLDGGANATTAGDRCHTWNTAVDTKAGCER